MPRPIALLCAALALTAGSLLLNAPNSGLLVGAAAADETAEIDVSTIQDMALGAEDAPVTIIEYASYTCPHCATFHAGPYKQLKADYIDTGKVRFIFREVYFDKYGLWASMIARCGGPEKFFGISDLIFDGQAEWTQAGSPTEIVDGLRKIGRLAGIETEALEACLQDAEMAQTLVAWYQQNVEADGITATPSFIVNGEKVDNQGYDSFSALIEKKLAE